MPAPVIANLEKLVGTARDGALLRFSLGNEYLKLGDPARAVPHLREAVSRDPAYSAAWKLLGRALAESGMAAEALDAYRRGIDVAESRGDKQAAKEMSVFARRLERQLSADPATRRDD
ncbi:MAG: tetratricopeptide repeat protein [Burkholderiales bacterium]|jgi:predicted Zn-dependent protease|nr:tetratricopeptide repeat protein [Burkholderiales bacterium]